MSSSLSEPTLRPSIFSAARFSLHDRKTRNSLVHSPSGCSEPCGIPLHGTSARHIRIGLCELLSPTGWKHKVSFSH